MKFYTCPDCGHTGRAREFGPREDLADRFMYNVEIPPDSEACWLWKGSRHTESGYGFFYPAANKTTTAHRFSYLLFKGEIPDNLMVHHSCKNTSCVNPEHLFAVTNGENLKLG